MAVASSLKTRLRWKLSKLKRETYYALNALRGFKQHRCDVDLDRVLIGNQCGKPLAKWVARSGEWDRVSCLLKDSPYVQLLNAVVEDETRLSQNSFLESQPYYRMAQTAVDTAGDYFGTTTPDAVMAHMRRFCLRCLRRDDAASSQNLAQDHQHSAPGDPVVMTKVFASDCYEIKDGHHRAALAYVAGEQRLSALIVDEKPTYLQSLLLSAGRKERPELRQPVDRPEFAQWTVTQECQEQLDAIMTFLTEHGLMSEIRTVLDMPCSYGWFVREFRRLGFDAMGVEQNAAYVQAGHLVYGLSDQVLRQGKLTALLKTSRRSYDLVRLSSMMQYPPLADQRAGDADFLRQLDRMTGKVLILDVVPNPESASSRRADDGDRERIESRILKNTSFKQVIELSSEPLHRRQIHDQDAAAPLVFLR